MRKIEITEPHTFDSFKQLLADDEPNAIICKLEHFAVLRELCSYIQTVRLEEQGIDIFKEKPPYITIIIKKSPKNKK